MFEIHFPAIKKKSRKPLQEVIVTGDSCITPTLHLEIGLWSPLKGLYD